MHQSMWCTEGGGRMNNPGILISQCDTLREGVNNPGDSDQSMWYPEGGGEQPGDSDQSMWYPEGGEDEQPLDSDQSMWDPGGGEDEQPWGFWSVHVMHSGRRWTTLEFWSVNVMPWGRGRMNNSVDSDQSMWYPEGGGEWTTLWILISQCDALREGEDEQPWGFWSVNVMPWGKGRVNNTGDSDLHPRNLAWHYQIILTPGNSDINISVRESTGCAHSFLPPSGNQNMLIKKWQIDRWHVNIIDREEWSRLTIGKA